MGRVRKVLLVGLLAVLAAIPIALSTPAVPATAPAAFDLDAVRALASSGSGPLPDRIDVVAVGNPSAPLLFTSAFAGVSSVDLPLVAVRAGYPDHSFLIDVACDDETQQGAFPSTPFDAEAYGRVQAAIGAARSITFTHEHFDHTATVPRSGPPAEVGPKLRLPAAQVGNRSELAAGGFTTELLALVRGVEADGPWLLDDGLVAIPAPGHTPGSQMVYARLQSGAEFLFIGDIAWNHAAIARLAGKPRLVQAILGEDGRAVAAQLRFLHDFEAAHPEVRVVPAHDPDVLAGLIGSGAFGRL